MRRKKDRMARQAGGTGVLQNESEGLAANHLRRLHPPLPQNVHNHLPHPPYLLKVQDQFPHPTLSFVYLPHLP